MATQFTVNGKAVVANSEPDTPLLWVIRDEVGLTGTKFGCGTALCGACTVHARRRSRCARARRRCSAAGGARSRRSRACRANNTHPLQKAWIEHDVPQCGYCQSGQLMSAAALLAQQQESERRRHRRGDERQHLPLRHLRAHQGGHQDRRRRHAQGLRRHA